MSSAGKKRALRRAALARMKTRARVLRPWDRAAKAANHLAKCSCWMCGNARRWHGPRIQELRAGQDECD